MEIFWKGTSSAKFGANRPKLYRNCVLLQNFYTSKFGEIMVFYAVKVTAEQFTSLFNEKRMSLLKG